jgi:hypothetical protein
MATFTMRADVRQENTDAVKYPHDVYVEHPTPIFERDVVDSASGTHSGIVANYVHVSEFLVRLLGRKLNAGRVGNVAGDAADMRAKILKAFDSSRQRFSIDIGEHDVHARLRKYPAEREPNTACAACHECGLATYVAH